MRPGPTGTSCLTCKRRHKKCDQRQPICERCETGDFECLGYSHIQDDPPVARVARPMRRILPRTIESKGSSPHSASSGFQGGSTVSDDSLSQTTQSKDSGLTSSLPTLSTSTNLNVSTKSTAVSGASMSIMMRISDLYTRLPYPIPGPSKTCLDSQRLIDTIIARGERVMSRWYFKPADSQKTHFRQVAAQRLRNSKFTCWVSFVGTSVIESFLAGDVSRKELHNNCIEYIEGSLKCELALDLAPHEMRDRQSTWIHVSLVKTMLVHSSSIYRLLQRITPTFLQVTYSNPTLWPSGSDLTRVPLLSILTSGPELAYFALTDCTYAMASGFPQHIEYDTTIYPQLSRSSLHQWSNTTPVEFLLVLSDINACRDKSPAARDWKEIEQWLLTWQSRPGQHAFAESWMTIAWYAIQESWRLALLIYLYLAVCNVPSDDPRIQSCIKQILQVVKTIKEPGPSDVNGSLFSQYLMIGICARSESHRKIARKKLTYANETGFWFMRAPDFIPVLDHLWHGAAAGGRPVKWGDYVHSREAVFPAVL